MMLWRGMGYAGFARYGTQCELFDAVATQDSLSRAKERRRQIAMMIGTRF